MPKKDTCDDEGSHLVPSCGTPWERNIIFVSETTYEIRLIVATASSQALSGDLTRGPALGLHKHDIGGTTGGPIAVEQLDYTTLY